MNKRRLHHLWTRFRTLKPAYFLMLAIVSATICVIALRHNNQEMGKLRAALYSADKSGVNVQQNLDALQHFVTAHMNTSLTAGNTSVYPPIQLEYTYERLVEAQGAQLQAANGQLYTNAQTYCQQQDPVDFSGHNRVPCIEQYVTSHGEAALPAIPDSLYQFDFVSPRWSPDLAGWSLLASIVLAVLAIILFIADRWFKTSLHERA